MAEVAAEKAAACPGCGHPLEETTDAAHRTEWVVDVDRCHACVAKHAEAERLRQTGGDLAGLYLTVHR